MGEGSSRGTYCSFVNFASHQRTALPFHLRCKFEILGSVKDDHPGGEITCKKKKQQQYFGSFPFGERSQPTPPITLLIVVWTSERLLYFKYGGHSKGLSIFDRFLWC